MIEDYHADVLGVKKKTIRDSRKTSWDAAWYMVNYWSLLTG